MKKQYLLLITSICLTLNSYGDSLWSKSQADSMFNNEKKYKVGDLITIKISAESTAVQEAGTTTRKSSDIGANFFDTFDLYSLDSENNSSLRKMQDYRIGGKDNYSGVGQTTRKSKVEAIVSCVITTVLPNGNLVISGERTVDVNNDSEIIQISGIVRPADIDLNNSVASYQVAQFNISLKGKGVVNSKQTPGFLSNFFNWVF
ncbi:MAG: flagellar basal body L-ring protein FlgH [Candidatus Marinamargulisbacteria bacterium]